MVSQISKLGQIELCLKTRNLTIIVNGAHSVPKYFLTFFFAVEKELQGCLPSQILSTNAA